MARSSAALLTLATLLATTVATTFAPAAQAHDVCSDLFKAEYVGLLNPASTVYMVTQLKQVLPEGTHLAEIGGERQLIQVRYDAGSPRGETPVRTGGVEIVLNHGPTISTKQVPLTIREGATPAQATQYSLKSMMQILPQNALKISTTVRKGNRAHHAGLTQQTIAIDLNVYIDKSVNDDHTIQGVLYTTVRKEFGTRRRPVEESQAQEIKIFVRAKS